jgi:endo-1,4-beta-xylanase
VLCLTASGAIGCGDRSGAGPNGAGGGSSVGGAGGDSAGGGSGGADVDAASGGGGGGGDGGAAGMGTGGDGTGGDPGGAGGDIAAGTGGASMGGAAGSTPTLKDAAAAAGRLIGAAISNQHLGEAAFAITAATEFNYITPENEMKWDATEPTRDVFTFGPATAIVNFGMQNGMKVKGHTLVWHSQLPAWVSSLTDPNEVRAAMLNHITQLVSHFRGKVTAWDVVNEAFNDGSSGTLRSTVFSQYLGDGFIDEAFIAARAADPDARLYYNDYGTEGSSVKADAVYTLVQSMRNRSIPIDGVGLQMHSGALDSSPSAAELAFNMQRLAALGLEVVISEMDVQICTGDVDTQRMRFHDVVAACVAEPACTAVTVWGVPDKYSWRNGRTCATPRPLLFDDSYLRKPAYIGVLDALMGR